MLSLLEVVAVVGSGESKAVGLLSGSQVRAAGKPGHVTISHLSHGPDIPSQAVSFTPSPTKMS